jgi:hypothetical protein
MVVKSIKNQCTCATKRLIQVFERCFHIDDLMNATRIIFPWYWEALDMEVTSPNHLAILKAKLPSQANISKWFLGY